jgi:hypothetical protein
VKTTKLALQPYKNFSGTTSWRITGWFLGDRVRKSFKDKQEALAEKNTLAKAALKTHNITRLLIWIAEGANTQSRGARATVALHCVRPDLIGNITLWQIGDMAGISKQAAHTLARGFRVSIGF